MNVLLGMGSFYLGNVLNNLISFYCTLKGTIFYDMKFFLEGMHLLYPIMNMLWQIQEMIGSKSTHRINIMKRC